MSAEDSAEALGALHLGEAEAKTSSTRDMLEVKPLWGGAARSAVPVDWADVSEIREVPDNQEVFVEEALSSAISSRSLIFDIVEAAIQDDLAAAQHYMQDLFETTQAVDCAVFDTGTLEPIALSGAMPEGAIPPSCVGAFGRMLVGKFRSTAEEAPDVVDVAMLVLRIPHVETDILVTLNLPRKLAAHPHRQEAEVGEEEVKPTEAGNTSVGHITAEESLLEDSLETEHVQSLQGSARGDLQILSGVLESFSIEDWGLFGL